MNIEPPGLEDLTPAEAFECNREMKRCHRKLIAARVGFVADWPEWIVKIRELLAKVHR